MKNRLTIVILIILIGGALGNALRFTEQKPERPAEFSGIPLQYGDYTGVEHQIADFADEILQADVTTLRDYITIEGRRTQLFVAYFGSQKYGSQIHSPKHCLPGGGWKINEAEPYKLNIPGFGSKDINRMIISVGGYKAVMLYWYESRTGSIRDEYGLKIDLVKNSLFFRPTDAAIIRLVVDATDGNIEAATKFGIGFLGDFYRFIDSSLPF
jgi:EpsI family protein